MAAFELPPVKNHRWYLSRHTRKYGKLKLQRKVWYGWKTVGEELVCITGRQFPLNIALANAAGDIIRVLKAPKVKYGVIM